MSLLIRFAVAPLVFLVPVVAIAESEDSCAHATYEDPRLHPSNQPMARDGWIALASDSESGSYAHRFTDVRVRDAAGQEIATTAVFDETTRRDYEIFAPVEVLEAGDYELVFTNSPDCFEPLEVVLPLVVAEALAEPIDAKPEIGELEAVVFDGRSLHLEVDIPTQSAPGWILVDADFSPDLSWPVDTLLAPGEPARVVFHRDVQDEDTSAVCVRATFYDLAGVASPTAERCTTKIEHRSSAQGCRVGGTSSPTWALGLLLALALCRRRSR
jgi:MYXO-CTERM domain-containing protein